VGLCNRLAIFKLKGLSMWIAPKFLKPCESSSIQFVLGVSPVNWTNRREVQKVGKGLPRNQDFRDLLQMTTFGGGLPWGW
jgi:hypothetical protein